MEVYANTNANVNENINENINEKVSLSTNVLEAEHKQTPNDHCHTEGAERKSHHSDKVKNSLIHRLNRIEGQIRGIKGLIEKDTYCDDVLNQIASVQAALYGVGKLLLEHHLKSCVIERIQAGDTEVIGEMMTTLNKLIK